MTKIKSLQAILHKIFRGNATRVHPEIEREQRIKKSQSTLTFQGSSKFYNSCRQLFDGSGTTIH